MRGLSKKLKTGSCLFLPRLHAPLFYIEFRRRVSRVTVSGIELHTHTQKTDKQTQVSCTCSIGGCESESGVSLGRCVQ